MRRHNSEQGFSLVELITVMVIIGVLATYTASRMLPHTTLQLQGGRDSLIAALFIAQQKAMAQADPVRLTTSGNQIDIRVDSNGDGSFSAAESIRAAGTVYPVSLNGGLSLSNNTLDFNRLGKTSATSISVNKGTTTVNVTVTGSGYAF